MFLAVFRGLIFYILCFVGQANATDLGEMFAKADSLPEQSVRVASLSTVDTNEQYLLTTSGAKLLVHFVAPTDSVKPTFVFLGGVDSDIDDYAEVEEALAPLGYGIIRTEFAQATDLDSVLSQLKLTNVILVGEAEGAGVMIQVAQSIHAAGLNLVNWNITPEKAEELKATGIPARLYDGVTEDSLAAFANFLLQ